ncbi:hypothetical protein EKTHUN627_27120 [Enterobacter kobei]|nr:hypothetical protein EKTHUN627_27120 [Enterobacter kobei]GJA01044.1 hypothetical protein ECV0102_13920 [Enterobacter cloacae]
MLHSATLSSVTHPFHHLNKNAYFTTGAKEGNHLKKKCVLPRDKLIDCANAAKKLYILIAHHIDRLRP